MEQSTRTHLSDKRGAPAELVWQASSLAVYPPATVSITSLDPRGARLDYLPDVRLSSVPCAAGIPEELECAETAPIRAVSDMIDRMHPAALGRSLRAEV